MNFQSGPSPALPAARLRLVDASDVGTPAELRASRRDVARENHTARMVGGLGADDARWLLAQEVERSVEGGRAAIVRPEVRRRLMSRAKRSGLRPFDANLVIAIVQDAARRGEPMQAEPVQRLAMVGAPVDRSGLTALSLLAVAVVLACGLLLGLIAWLMA